MKRRLKKEFIVGGVCLLVLLAIPLYAAFGDVILPPINRPTRCKAVDPLDHRQLLPNPDDCSSFFMCSMGIPLLQNCPEGLHFNAMLNVCDWPQNAGCEHIP